MPALATLEGRSKSRNVPSGVVVEGTDGIEPIQARSPQAKGRIERLFETLQDRLVKAMRLAGISDLDAANAFLERYLPEHNERFATPARQPGGAHQPWQCKRSALDRICALHHERKISKDVVVSFQNQHYLVLTRGNRLYSTLRGSRVTVCEHLDGPRSSAHTHARNHLWRKSFSPRAPGPSRPVS